MCVLVPTVTPLLLLGAIAYGFQVIAIQYRFSSNLAVIQSYPVAAIR